MASNKMLQVNLKPYPHQLTSSHRFPVPIAMERPRKFSTYTSQLLCSSSNLSRFVVANTMASNEMLIVTTEQPIQGSLSVLTMSDDQIMNHIYAGHVHAENILQQSTHIVDNVLQELSLLAKKINIAFNLRKMKKELSHRQIEDVEAYIYWEELAETPKDIVDAFRALIFAKDHLHPLIDGSTNKMVVYGKPQGEVEYPNAFRMIRLWGMNDCFTNPVKKARIPANRRMFSIHGDVIGPKDKDWMKRFAQKANHVAQDSLMKDLNITIELYPVGNKNKNEAKQRLLKVTNGNQGRVNKFLDAFKTNSRGRVVLSNEHGMLVADHGVKMLMVLERFDRHWKKKVEKIGFGRSFVFSHNNFN